MQVDKSLLRDIIQWDVNSWSDAFYFWERDIQLENQKCLALGESKGGLSLWLALNNNNVICSDLENTEVTSLPLHKKYKIESIKYEDIDAANIPYENEFDIIIFKSILGGVGWNNNFPLQERAMQQIIKALKPGGKLLFAENLSGSRIHIFFRKHFVQWGKKWRYVSLKEMEYFLSGFSIYNYKTNGFIATFGRSENQRNVLSKIDKILFNRLLPHNWHYIIYGWAKK